jgi:bacillithiol biosynthesis deacetylase BshB1
MKLDILAFGAHPDDVELGAAGTIAKHIANGLSVGIVDLTQGELGTRGSAALRKKEANKSKEILGVSYRANLKMADGYFEETQNNLNLIIEEIRKTQPKIVLCNAVEDRHPDHGRGSHLVSRACFLSGLRKIETQDDNGKQEAWRPEVVYHYVQDRYIEPDVVIDVTQFWQQKMDAIMAYSSQFFNPDSEEPSSPISGEEFLQSVEAKSRTFGRLINAELGEGFTVERPVKVDLLSDLK